MILIIRLRSKRIMENKYIFAEKEDCSDYLFRNIYGKLKPPDLGHRRIYNFSEKIPADIV